MEYKTIKGTDNMTTEKEKTIIVDREKEITLLNIIFNKYGMTTKYLPVITDDLIKWKNNIKEKQWCRHISYNLEGKCIFSGIPCQGQDISHWKFCPICAAQNPDDLPFRLNSNMPMEMFQKKIEIKEEEEEEEEVLDDGFGNKCSIKCVHCGNNNMYIVRPGDFRCAVCDD